MVENNITPIYEFYVHRLYGLIRRKTIDKSIDTLALREALYKALRALMWYYKDVDQSPIVGCQFELISTEFGPTSVSIRSSLFTNSNSEIEFKNEKLKKCIIDMYSKKFLSEKKIFFHWKVIEDFEKDVEQKRKRAAKKRKKS